VNENTRQDWCGHRRQLPTWLLHGLGACVTNGQPGPLNPDRRNLASAHVVLVGLLVKGGHWIERLEDRRFNLARKVPNEVRLCLWPLAVTGQLQRVPKERGSPSADEGTEPVFDSIESAVLIYRR
jgi:hypothetical protein